MASIRIVSDSDCDLPREMIEERGIVIVPFRVSLGDDKYYMDYYEITPEEFYSKLRSTDAFPKTSLPSPADYEERIRPCLERGEDVIAITISSKFSGSYQSLVTAAKNLGDEFPGRKIAAIDSQRCTVLHGVFTLQAHEMAERGWEFEQIVDRLEQIKDDYSLYLTVDSLDYLRKGGRVGKANAIAGNLLNIKPIIEFREGELHGSGKIRGTKKALNEIIDLTNKKTGSKKDEYDFVVFHSDELANAEEVMTRMETEFGYKFKYPIMRICPVVGAHLGPTGTVVIGYARYEMA